MALIVELKVAPQAGKSLITSDKVGGIKVYLKSAPEDGKANKELIKLFAHTLHITQEQVTIVSGLTSRKKKIKIDIPLTYEELLHKLGLDTQNRLF